MNIDAMQQAWRVYQDNTQIHFLYFAIGFSAATILWLTLLIGFIIGIWRRRRGEVK